MIPQRSSRHRLVSASSVGQIREALRQQGGQSVEGLREIGRQIELALRDEAAGIREAGLDAAALFTAACSARSDKGQEALLGVQDKVLAGLRAMISSSLPPDQYHPLRAALLPLVAQPAFVKKRKGYRQHLVQALAEAASGPLPPIALLPILLAKETGPAAADLALEILERITTRAEEKNGGGGFIDTSAKAIIELLRHLVAEVISSGATTKGKRGTIKGPQAHLTSFLVQACSSLPDFILVFAKDLLDLSGSRSSSLRKLSLAVLSVVLEHGHGHGHGLRAGAACRATTTPDPALAAVLRFARSDGDATVRCLAFDIVAGYVGQMETTCFDRRDEDCCIDLDSSSDTSDVAVPERPEIMAGAVVDDRGSGDGDDSGGDLEARLREMDIAPCAGGTPDHDGGDCLGPPAEKTPAISTREIAMGRATRGRNGGVRGRGATASAHDENVGANLERRDGGGGRVSQGPWSVRGSLLSSLSAASDALSGDGSKAVRARALACSFRILEVHGGDVRAGGPRRGVAEEREGQFISDSVNDVIAKVAKGAWRALEALAEDGRGTASLLSSGGGDGGRSGGGHSRQRKAADAARDLLTLPCVDAKPVDLVRCFARCSRVGPGADRGAEAAGAMEAKRALREVARAIFCEDLGTLLNATSDVMASDERNGGNGDGDPMDGSADTSEGASSSLSEVLRKVLAGVGGDVIEPLLRETLEAYTHREDDQSRGRCNGYVEYGGEDFLLIESEAAAEIVRQAVLLQKF